MFLFIVSILIYLPGLPGGFIYDDYFNILFNSAISNSDLSFSSAVTAYQSGVSGPLGRPIAMLSFYVNYQLSGFSPISFKLFNILIHSINTILVFIITCHFLKLIPANENQILEQKQLLKLAFFISLLWAVHPINVTAVLYVVQRMTSMAAMFTFFGILFYLILRQSQNKSLKSFNFYLVLISFCGITSVYCKENGALLFIFLLLIETLVFKWKALNSRQLLNLKLFYLLTVFIPICIALFMLMNGQLTANYSGRTFDILQRVLTECRVIWFYIFQIILPQASSFNLYHDDFIVSESLLNPVSTIISIIGLIILFCFIYKYRKKVSWFSLGLCLFFTGHLMESTILPLNLVHEHRNYFPSYGIIFAFVIFISNLVKNNKILNSNVIILVMILNVSFITITRAFDWSDNLLLSQRLAQKNPNSVSANYELGFAYANSYQLSNDIRFANKAEMTLYKAVSLSEKDLKPKIALLHVQAMSGKVEDNLIVDSIANSFNSRQVSVFELVAFHQYLQCYIENICASENILVLQPMFDALLANSFITARLKDDVLYFYSKYLLFVPGSEKENLMIMSDVSKRNPDIFEYQKHMVQVYLNNGEVEKAEKLMLALKEKYAIEWNVIAR